MEIWLTKTQNIIAIQIKDQGIGIPKDDMPYIYDPYFRARNTSKFEGYGIGLPLTRNIVRLHKGNLVVQSDENQGTFVSIELEIAKVL